MSYRTSLPFAHRHPEERQVQQRRLQEDAEAKSWKQAIATKDALEEVDTSATEEIVNPERTARRLKAEVRHGDEVAGSPRLQQHRDMPQPAAQGLSKLNELPAGTCGREKRGDKDQHGRGADSAGGERFPCDTDRHDGKEVATTRQVFLCNVVPLSLALGQLGIDAVDLLKVDVEGDELAVLQGVSADDWRKIRQVRQKVGAR